MGFDDDHDFKATVALARTIWNKIHVHFQLCLGFKFHQVGEIVGAGTRRNLL